MADGPWTQYQSTSVDATQGPWNKYAPSAPAADADKPSPFTPGSYQARKGGPVLDPSKSPLRTGVESLEGTMGIKNPTSLGDAASQFGSAFVGQAKDSFSNWKKALGGDEPMEKYLPLSSAGAALMTPFDLAAKGIESIVGGIESGSKDILAGWKTGDQPNDWRSIASGFGTLAGTKMQLDAPEHVGRAFKTATTLIERQPTVEQGKIGYVNAARQAVDRLDNAVRTTGVGARAQSVIEADKLDNARTQSAGKVNTTDAVLAGQRMMDNTKLGAAPGGYPAQMSLDSAKALITQLGREASRMERTGKSPEAAAIWAEYDALRKATQDRATELGPEHGKNWRDYIAEHKNYMQLQNGLLGHITEGEHTSALSKIIEHSGQLPELQKWFDKYSVDMKPIRDAATEGGKLNDLTKQSSNALYGKIKLLSRHWMLGLPAVEGAALGAKAMGFTGAIGGFVIPLLIAGKVGGLLDTMQVKSLLYDLQRKLPPEQFQVAGSPKGPMETLHTAASTPPAAEPAGYSGPERRTGGGEDWMEYERRGAGKATPQTPEEVAGAKDRAETKAAEESLSKSALAGKLSKARSVYKGRR